MSLFGTYQFATGGITGGGRGNHVYTQDMINVVEAYIYQEKGEDVEIEFHPFDRRQKDLLLKAYAWANDHLK